MPKIKIPLKDKYLQTNRRLISFDTQGAHAKHKRNTLRSTEGEWDFKRQITGNNRI